MDRIEQLVQTLEADLHIEFPASRREQAKDEIRRWLHKYDVSRATASHDVAPHLGTVEEPERITDAS